MKTITEMAREAGGGLSCIAEPLEHPWKFSQDELERFAELVRADERNHIAGVFEDNHEVVKHRNNYWLHAANYVRGRGNT